MKALLLFAILLVIDATKISPEENKKLRKECGPVFKSSASASTFPPWMFSVQPGYPNDRVAGVIISSKHILTHHSWKLQPSGVQAATTNKCYDDDEQCDFNNLTLRYISRGLRIYELNGNAKFPTTPICLPKNLTGAEKTNFPKGEPVVFDKTFPKKMGKLNSSPRKIITITYPFQTKGEGKGAIVGSHTRRAYLIGFDAAAGQRNMLDMRVFESDICSTTGVCHNKNLPATTPPSTTTIPTSTTQQTTTEATTLPETTPEPTTTEAPPPPTTTKAPKKPKKPKKNKNGKEQLPFEYDQEDFIYWPEETTKTANWKGTLWVTVAVAFWL